MKTYENVVAKRIVQDRLFNQVGSFPSSAVALLGPNPKPYLKRLRKVIGTHRTIHNYELNPQTFQEHHTNIKTTVGDVFYATPQRFMDLDLMRTYKTEGYLLRHLFEQQKVKFPERKVFMFTLSMRGTKIDDIRNFLSELLQSTVKVGKEKESIIKGRNIFKYKFFTEKRYSIEAYTYKDTSRMISILVNYR